MTLFGIIFLTLEILLLIVVTAIKIEAPIKSRFELERLKKVGDKQATAQLKKLDYLNDARAFLRILTALGLVGVTLSSVAILGWTLGILLSVVLALGLNILSRLKLSHWAAQKIFIKIEDYLFKFVIWAQPFFKLFTGFLGEAQEPKISSKQELAHIIKQLDSVLAADQKKQLLQSLEFNDKLVASITTPRSMIDFVKKDDLLGPLMLDKLYKTGHSRIPVIGQDIDHVEGMLYVQDLLSVESKKSPKVAQVMKPEVFYIREDQTLKQALNAFIKLKHHLFVVVNRYRETVGVLSLEDVIEALLGRKIIDEFDSYDDLRAVAEQNPRANQSTKNSKDV